MKLRATITKDGVVFSVEDEDGQSTEVGPVRKMGYRRFLAAVDALDEAVVGRQLGESVTLADEED